MGSSIVLGVGGGIAAYKAALLLRLFTEDGYSVRVVPTEAALRFVGAPTWEALSGHSVSSDVFDDVEQVPHVRLGQQADLVVVAPTTANVLAKAAHGLADDLLTNTLLTAHGPVVLAPAMHTEMWQHPATVANVTTLRERGITVIEPAAGRLTGADTGPGRLPDPEDIYAVCRQLLQERAASSTTAARDLEGRHIVVSAGGTREFVDPVRFLGNRSSGRQGIALAQAAAERGARVTLVAANVSLPTPDGVDVVRVVTTEELRVAMLAQLESSDVVIMAAAPSDFRPAVMAQNKIKKTTDGSAPTITLVQNPDILRELVQERADGADQRHPVIVGFAAETGDESATVLEHAAAKLKRKGCDLLVVNDVSGDKVFGHDHSEVVILRPDGPSREVPFGPKSGVASAIIDEIVRTLS